MPVTKRTRFEVLRRDGHRCRYCGVGADVVTLQVDHVLPVALGGTDDPANLAAACPDCNTGKASTSPDAPLVARVNDDVVRWRRAIQDAADIALADREMRRADQRAVLEEWSCWTKGSDPVPLPEDWRNNVDRWRAAGVPLAMLLDLVDIAMSAPRVPSQRVWNYYAGCCWRRVDEIQAAASALLRDEVSSRGAS